MYKVLLFAFCILIFAAFGFAFSLSASESFADSGFSKYYPCTGSGSVAVAVSVSSSGSDADAANISKSYFVASIVSSYFKLGECFTGEGYVCSIPNTSNVGQIDFGGPTTPSIRTSYVAGTGLQNAYVSYIGSTKYTHHESAIIDNGPNDYYSIGYGELMANGRTDLIGSGSTITTTASGLLSPYRVPEGTGANNIKLLSPGFSWSNSFSTYVGAIGPSPTAWSYGHTSGGAHSSYAESGVGPDNTVQVPIYPISIAYVFNSATNKYDDEPGFFASTCGTPLYYKTTATGGVSLSASSVTKTVFGAGQNYDGVTCPSINSQSSTSEASDNSASSISSRPVYCNVDPSILPLDNRFNPPVQIDLCSTLGVPPTQENIAALNTFLTSYNGITKIVTYNPVVRPVPSFVWPDYDDGTVYGALRSWASPVYITYELASECGSPSVSPSDFPGSPGNVPGVGPVDFPSGSNVPGGNIPVINNKPFRCEVSASPNSQIVNSSVQWEVKVFDSVGNVAIWPVSDLSYVWTGSEGLTGNSSQVSKPYANIGQQYAQVKITSNSKAFFPLICSNTARIQTPLEVSCTGFLDSSNGSTITWRAFPKGGEFNSTMINSPQRYTYLWTFNPEPELGFDDSGVIQTGAMYSTNGNKTATVMVWDPVGNSVSATCSVPLVDFSVDCSPDKTNYVVGENVNWQATVSPTNPDQSYAFKWSGENINNRTGAQVTTSYLTPEVKYATVTVTATSNSDGTSVSQVFNCNPAIVTQNPLGPSCMIAPNRDAILSNSDSSMVVLTQNFINPITTTIANCGDSATPQNKDNCNGILNNSCTFDCVNYTNSTGNIMTVHPTVTLSNGFGESATCSADLNIVSGVSLCGNGTINLGEICGEPGLSSCASGQHCDNCLCVNDPVVNRCGDGVLDPATENCEAPNWTCGVNQVCNVSTCLCSFVIPGQLNVSCRGDVTSQTAPYGISWKGSIQNGSSPYDVNWIFSEHRPASTFLDYFHYSVSGIAPLIDTRVHSYSSVGVKDTSFVVKDSSGKIATGVCSSTIIEGVVSGGDITSLLCKLSVINSVPKEAVNISYTCDGTANLEIFDNKGVLRHTSPRLNCDKQNHTYSDYTFDSNATGIYSVRMIGTVCNKEEFFLLSGAAKTNVPDNSLIVVVLLACAVVFVLSIKRRK